MCVDADVRTVNVAAGAKDDVEESGWKMVSGDVFRSPKSAMLLCVQLGSGVQIILSSFITLFFAALGAHRPSAPLHRDAALARRERGILMHATSGALQRPNRFSNIAHIGNFRTSIILVKLLLFKTRVECLVQLCPS